MISIYPEKESSIEIKRPEFNISLYDDDDFKELQRIEALRQTHFEIVWVERGAGKYTIDFVDYPFEGPCLFLLSPQNIHTLEKNCTTIGGVVQFSTSFFAADTDTENFILNYGVFDDIDALPVINFKKSEAEIIQKTFNDLYAEFQNEGLFSEAILLSYLKIFLLKIYEIKKSKVQIDCFKSSEYSRYRNLQQLLDKNYKKESAVSFYADYLNVSTKTLGNITQKFTGKPPQQLIKERILLEAKRLLHFSDLSIKEIALQLGFADSSYFTRFFKKNTKANPSSYRIKNL